MPEPDSPYRAPTGEGMAALRERGSRFVAWVGPARSEAEAKAAVAAQRERHPGATHHCFAWRLGQPAAERASDAGEPAGTAGQPMLRVLAGAGLSDVVAVVARWFGGTKLGKGGLARCYAAVVRRALAALPTAERVPTERLRLEVPYAKLGAVRRLVQPPQVALVEERGGAAGAVVTLEVWKEARPRLEEALAELRLTAEAAPQ